MSDYLKEKNIKLINDGKFILIEKDGVETKYRISITSLSFKQGLIRNLMILLESKDRDFIKGVVDSWYKEFKKGETPPIEKKESVSMDFSVVLKAFEDFKEEMRERVLIEQSLYEEKDNLDYQLHYLKTEIEELKEKHRKEKEDWVDQIITLQEENEELKERNEELEERVEDLVRDLEYIDNERINDF